MAKLLKALGMAAGLLLSACATGSAGHGAAPVAKMAVWTVPSVHFESGRPAFIQVSIVPLVSMKNATLGIDPGGLELLSPGRFVLGDLDPGQYGPAKDTGHVPPALGKTLIRSFKVMAPRPGKYQVEITLDASSGRQSSTLSVIAQ